MALADMKRTKGEKKAERDRYKVGAADSADDYHHGLHIELDHDGMKKLGMDEMPKPGDEYRGEFRGRVTHASEEADEDGEPRRRVRMVMHHMGMDADGDCDGDKKSDKAADDIRKVAGKK